MYSSVISKKTLSKSRRRWTSEELRAFGTRLCAFRREVLELLTYMRISRVHTMRFYLLDQLVDGVKRFVHILVLDAFLHQ